MALNFLNSLDADDIFISYSREDGETYLNGLSEALTKLGFSCFDDRQGTDAGPLPPETLFRKIRGCRTLVLLATQGAVTKSKYLAEEVEKFAAANGTTRIVAVSFDEGEAALDDWTGAEWFDLVYGKSRARELREALKTGTPSTAVVSRIEKQSNYLKSKDRLRRYRNRALWVLAWLVVSIVAAAVLAGFMFKHADAETRKAIEETSKAERATSEADQARVQAFAAQVEALTSKLAAELSKAEAERQKRLAKTASDDAAEKAKLADAATRKAQAAQARADTEQARADRQGAIAESRRLANDSQALLRQHPEELREGVALAINSAEKAGTVGGGILEADTALRESLALLPYFHPAGWIKGNVRPTALSPDGGYFASLQSPGGLSIYEVGGESQPVNVPGDGNSVALSNGGLYAAFASYRGVTIFDVKNNRGDPLKSEAKTDNAEEIALSPGGRYLAVAQRGNLPATAPVFKCGAGWAQVVDVKSGKVVKTINAGADFGMAICDIAFGPSGNLAIGGYDLRPHGDSSGQVVIWPLSAKLRDGEAAGELTEADFSNPIVQYQDDVVELVAPGEDETYFATDKAVWKSTHRFKYEAVTTIPASKEESKCHFIGLGIGFNSDLSILGVAFRPGGRQLTVARCLSKSSEPKVDLFANDNISLETWDATGHRDLSHAFSAAAISNLAFVPGDRLIAAVYKSLNETTVGVLGVGDGEWMKTFKEGVEGERRVFVAEDARYVLTADGDTAQVRDVWGKNPTAPATLDRDFYSLNDVAFSADGKTFALLGENGEFAAVVYRLEGDSYKKKFVKRDDGMYISQSENERTFDLSADGQFLATAAGRPDGWGVRLWDLRDEGEVADAPRGRLLKCDGLPRSVQFSPKGSYVAAICAPRYVRVWRVADGEEVGSLEYDVGPSELTTGISFYRFDPTEHYLFAVGGSGHSRLLHLPTKREQTLLRDTSVGAAAFSRDGSYLAVGTGEGLVRVYRTDDLNREVARLPHDGAVTAIAFSDDARYVATASARHGPYGTGKEDFPLRVWLLCREDLLDEATRRLNKLPEFVR